MLDLARRADDRALAIALDRFGVAAERGDQRVRHVETERLQIVGEADDLLDIATGEGVSDDGKDRSATIGRFRNGSTFMEDLLNQGDLLANLNRRHGAPFVHCGRPLERGRGNRLRGRLQGGFVPQALALPLQ
jgi:hypothetical protein